MPKAKLTLNQKIRAANKDLKALNKDLTKSLDVKPGASIYLAPSEAGGVLTVAAANEKTKITGLQGKWTQISLDRAVVGFVNIGAAPGYASPVGLDATRMLIVVDDAIPASPNLVAGANEAGAGKHPPIADLPRAIQFAHDRDAAALARVPGVVPAAPV
mgnify:CR=1 FL=1